MNIRSVLRAQHRENRGRGGCRGWGVPLRRLYYQPEHGLVVRRITDIRPVGRYGGTLYGGFSAEQDKCSAGRKRRDKQDRHFGDRGVRPRK
ncbi:hypothetical protein AYI68_g1834, partial [Smittium mucronatum]